MDYSKIIAVSGLQGLYELVSSKSDGAIVRSLEDKSTRFVSSRIHNFSHLESIEIYTVRDNVNLAEILQAMEKNSKALPEVKDAAAVRKYFEEVYPDLDFERVYASDMKKIVKWFEVLKNNDIEIKLTEPEPEEEVVAEPVVERPAAKKAAPAAKEEPKKKAVAESKEEPKAKVKTKAVEKEAPKKATKAAAPKAAKAKKEEKEEAPKKKAAPKKK